MKTYSTAQVAKKLGIHKITLIRWLLYGDLEEPRRLDQAGQVIRIWTDRDVVRARTYKTAHYRKGRGRKKVKKSKV